MPPQPLVQLPLQLRPQPPQPLLLEVAVAVDQDLLVPVVRVTRVDPLQLLIPLTSDSPTVAAAVEISGRFGRRSG
jgi:hypothetical protein